ncbi:MAG: glycosyltransferase family 4 protein, partial [Solirubrobacterales bacterium]|nr:glycosyltransferase family 4 protein [Solirubrobacterales bacterium]
YRRPLYERLSERHELEVVCFGGGERYVPTWFRGPDDRSASNGRLRVKRISGALEAAALAKQFDTVVAPFAGGAVLPAAYAGARLGRRAFILWASVWAQPRSFSHALALPATHHIYKHADAVLAYGEHVKRYVGRIRGRDDDVFVAAQAVEPELFGRQVDSSEVESFRARHGLGGKPLVLYVGRLTTSKGIEVLLDAWQRVWGTGATLVLVGDGPLADRCASLQRARLLGPLPREELPIAYAASALAVLPSIPTARFKEPWGLVCNEAMHQRVPVVASDAVGAVAGGLVSDNRTGLVVPAGDPIALRAAIERLLADEPLRSRLGAAGGAAVAGYSYDAALSAFELALATAKNERSRA